MGAGRFQSMRARSNFAEELRSTRSSVLVLLEGVLVHLLGAGQALPSTSISNDFLQEVLPRLSGAYAPGFHLSERIQNRRSVLPLQYIADTKNKDLLEARKVTLSSPTSLAVSAIEQALARAGITKEHIGMIVADCATPFQTCPSEAQRIGGALGIKIPAFDVAGGAASFSLYLDLFASWDESKLPDYVVWVSTNTPTLHVNYGENSSAPFIFGDGAAAVVVSTRVPGRITITSSAFRRALEGGITSTIDPYISFDSSAVPSDESVNSQVLSALSNAQKYRSGPSSKLFVIGPQLGGGDVLDVCSKAGLENVVPLSSLNQNGYSLGSCGMIELALNWDTLSPGDVVSVSHVGDGFVGSCELVVSE
jgi:3-oxoacyl-[acyl-carrier-protein] synthase-3